MPENCPADVQPFSQSEIIQNPNVFNLNYTNQDFWSMKTRLVEFMRERFGENGTVIPNTFNDLVEGSIAIMLTENWAFLADTLSFKMDQIVNELFIDTVTEIDNAFRLSRLVGFEPTPPIPARSLWSATIFNTFTTDIVIPAPVIVEVTVDEGPIIIELFPADPDNNPIFNQDIIIPAGALVNQAIVGLEGETVTDTFVGTGETLQTYQLASAPVLFDSITVSVDGVVWEEVEFFTESQPRREYRVEYDSSYNGYVMFGNNRAGLSPSPGSQIEITYRIGGGTRGNIVTGFVTTEQQAFVPGLEFSVTVTFTNYTRGEFGYDGDTLEDIRRKLPEWISTQNRAVTGLDYKTIADQFATPYHGQVGKSTAVLRQSGCAANIVDIYILAKDEGGLMEASDELKTDLLDEFDIKKMLTDHVCVKDGTQILVDTSIEAVLDRFNRKFEQEIRTHIERRVNAFYDINNWEYGQTLDARDLTKALSDLKQIDSFQITFVTNDENNSGTVITANFNEIIRPDDLTISFLFT
jgi:hypothetical protein